MRAGRIHYAAAPTSGFATERSQTAPPSYTPPPVSLPALATSTVLGYTAAFATFLACLCFSLGVPTTFDTTVAGVQIPHHARCLRVSRHADYASAWLPVGSPVRAAELLLRLDRVYTAEHANRALRLRSTIVSQSVSKICNTSSESCFDVVQVGSIGSEETVNEVAAFDYVSATGDYSLAGAYLNLQGELALVAGNDYFLTPTLFCWANHTGVAPAGAAPIDTTSGSIIVSTAAGLGPAYCNHSSVQLFPSCAAVEAQWLALSSRFLYEHAEEALEERRTVVERADACSNGDRETAPYWLDCVRQQLCGCQSTPSIPYRRLGAKDVLTIMIDASGAGYFKAAHASTLERIPALMSTDAATWVAILRLVLMVFVAGITFIRSSQSTSNPSEIVLRAWRRVHGLRPIRTCSKSTMQNVMNAATGLLALGSRAAVLVAMSEILTEDGQGVVLASEVTGTTVSLVHFALRHANILALDPKRETPLMLFGGSMSLIDVTIAMLMAFNETPILGTRESFGSVGRMLAAVLLVVNCVNILLFSATACFVTSIAQTTTRTYRYLHALAGLLWLAQGCCLALTLSAAFVRPFAYSLVKNHPGSWGTARYAVAFGFIAASGPVRRAVVVDVVHCLERHGEEKPKHS